MAGGEQTPTASRSLLVPPVESFIAKGKSTLGEVWRQFAAQESIHRIIGSSADFGVSILDFGAPNQIVRLSIPEFGFSIFNFRLALSDLGSQV